MVNVDGEDVICYIPSSCRLSNFIDLANRSVLLSPVKSENARTKYSVYAVKYDQRYILLNLSICNRIIEDQLGRRYFSFLGRRKKVSQEMLIDGYKADLFIHDTKTIIEIKSLLSFQREADFPTIYSERALDQLNSIQSLLERGYRVCYIFVSLNPYVKKIILKPDSEFYGLFCQCIENGMLFEGFSISIKDGEVSLFSKLKVEIEK